MAQPVWPRGITSAVAACVLAPLFALAVLLQAPAAAAAPRPATLTDVFAKLSISAQPTDYVVIVDTSASMVDQGRYQLVKSALTRMAKALRSDDRVAVITFDTGPTVRRPLTIVGSKPEAIASSLPATANGQGTDIGSALNSALNLMQGISLRTRVAVLLLTDGKIDTPATSPYATVNSSGWAGLHQRAAALQSSHDIAPLAIALTSNTDAAVLTQVFSNVIDVPATNLGTYLSQVSTTVMKAAAVKKLQQGLEDPVTASLSGLTAAPSAQPVNVTISLHNTNPLVPVQVTGLGIAADPTSKVALTDAPAAIDIPAAGTATVNVKVSDALKPGAKATYRVTGSVTSSWQSVIVHDLGLTWKPSLTSSGVSVAELSANPSPSATAAATQTTAGGSRWLVLLIGALGLIAVCAAFFFVARAGWRASRPPLVGTVSVLRNGEVIEEGLLRGRRMSVTLTNPAITIVLTSTRNAQREPGVRIDVTNGKSRLRGQLFEAETFDVEGLNITYTTDRTRMLRLIGTD